MRTTDALASRLNAARVDRAAALDEAERERARVEAERRAPSPHVAAASALIGHPAREIKSVRGTPRGDVIELHDGSQFIVVHDDAPDADGKTGLMLLNRRSPALATYAERPTE